MKPYLAYFLSIFLCLVTRPVLAQDSNEDDILNKITYKQVGDINKTAGDESLIQSFKKQGLIDITSIYEKAPADLQFAHVLASQNMEKMIVIRYDLETNDSSLQGRTINLSEGKFLFHTKNHNHRPVAIYFTGFKQVELNPIIMQINLSDSNPQPRQHASLLWLKYIVNEAHAESIDCNVPPEERWMDIKKIGASIMKEAGSCAKTFFSSIYDSAKSAVTFSGLFSGHLFKDIAGVYNLGIEIFSNIGQTISNLYAGISQSPDILIKLICEILGGAVGGALVAAVTSVFGGALAAISTAEKFAKISKKIAAIISSLKGKIVKYAQESPTGKQISKTTNDVQTAYNKYDDKVHEVIKPTEKALDKTKKIVECTKSINTSPQGLPLTGPYSESAVMDGAH